MAHAQEPDFVLWRNGRVHLNRQGASVQSTTGSRVVRISGSDAGYTMFRGSRSDTFPAAFELRTLNKTLIFLVTVNIPSFYCMNHS